MDVRARSIGRAGSADPPGWCSSATALIAKVKRPRAHLANFSGVLQFVAYAGFDRLYGEKIKEAALLGARGAQILRHPCSAFLPRVALAALERIGRLYKVEEEVRGRSPHERHAVALQARGGTGA